jgi:hypothetical protein
MGQTGTIILTLPLTTGSSVAGRQTGPSKYNESPVLTTREEF